MAKLNFREFERFYPPTRADWRAWLDQNHADAPGIWLIYYKKGSGMPTVTYDEAVEEALCFGWIDSVPGKIDEKCYMQLFSPRKRKSVWSKLNKERIENLIAQGLMMPAGLAKIEAAKADGSWTSLDSVENLEMPDDLQQALDANPAARTNWDAFGNSVKKAILWWVVSAKRPETRQKRVAETVAKAAENKKANFPGQ